MQSSCAHHIHSTYARCETYNVGHASGAAHVREWTSAGAGWLGGVGMSGLFGLLDFDLAKQIDQTRLHTQLVLRNFDGVVLYIIGPKTHGAAH